MNDSSNSLKTRVLRSGAWATGGFLAAQILRLGGNLLLTRMLFPQAFGLMAMVYVLMSGMQLLSDLGIAQSIVNNKRGEEQVFLNTAWSLQVLRGILLWLLAMLFASCLPVMTQLGWVAPFSVFADPLLPWLIGVFSFASVILGFESIKAALAKRHIQLRLITQIELLSQGISLVFTAVLAWHFHSVWAMVIGALISTFVRVLLGYVVLPGPACAFSLDATCVREMLHFGKWIFILSILGFLTTSGDRLILGGMLSSAQLGLYAIAFLLVNMAYVLFNSILSRVVFPAISEVVRNRPEDLSRVYQKFQFGSDVFLFTSTGFLVLAGGGLVDVLYDERYHPAGHILRFLAIGLIGARYLVVDQCCLAMREMRYMAAYRVFGLIAIFVSVPVGFNLDGFDGALIGIVISQFAGWPVALHFKIRHMTTDWKRELVGIPFFAISAAMGFGLMQLLSHYKLM